MHMQGREAVLKQLLGGANWKQPPWIEPPFHVSEAGHQRLLVAADQRGCAMALPARSHLLPYPQVNYGVNLKVGKRFYANAGCTILDDTLVQIGDRVLMGPNVKVYTAGHHVEPVARSGREGSLLVKPVKARGAVAGGGGVGGDRVAGCAVAGWRLVGVRQLWNRGVCASETVLFDGLAYADRQ